MQIAKKGFYPDAYLVFFPKSTWDDTYPKENFLTEIKETNEKGELVTNEDGTVKMKKVSQPPKDGAWIVKNSWGVNLCDKGYMYVSYYDSIFARTAKLYSFSAETSENYELIEHTQSRWVPKTPVLQGAFEESYSR